MILRIPSKEPSRGPTSRLTLRFWLVLVCLIQLCFSLSLWRLGLAIGGDSTEVLTASLRLQISAAVNNAVQEAMLQPVRAVKTLNYLYATLYRGKLGTSNVTSLSSKDTFLEPLAFVSDFWEVSSVGCAAVSGLVAMSVREGIPSDPDTLSFRYKYYVTDTVHDNCSAVYAPPEEFKKTNVDSTLDCGNSYDLDLGWAVDIPDFGAASSYSELQHYFTGVAPLNYLNSEWWQAANAANGVMRISVQNGLDLPGAYLAASQSKLNANGEPLFTCFAGVDLISLSGLLGSVDIIGERGFVLAVASDGQVVASSNTTSISISNNVFTSPDPLLQQVTAQWDLEAIYDVDGDGQTCSTAGILTNNGLTFHFAVRSINVSSVGWDFLLVVVTCDNDFVTQYTADLASMYIAVSAVLLAAGILIAFTFLLSIPLRRLTSTILQFAHPLEEARNGVTSTALKLSLAERFSVIIRSWKSPQSTYERLIETFSTVFMGEFTALHWAFGQLVENLQASYSELEASHTAKQHFVRYICHEVRVPLNALSLGMEDLKASLHGGHQIGADGAMSPRPFAPCKCMAKFSPSTSQLSSECCELLSVLREQTGVVSRIVNDVLSLAKIEDGALELQYAPFSMQQMMVSTLKAFEVVLKGKGCSFICDIRPPRLDAKSLKTQRNSREDGEGKEKVTTTLATAAATMVSPPSKWTAGTFSAGDGAECRVIGDGYRLRQIFSNLLSNAIKFSPKGGCIHVELREVDDLLEVEVEGLRCDTAPHDDPMGRLWTKPPAEGVPPPKSFTDMQSIHVHSSRPFPIIRRGQVAPAPSPMGLGVASPLGSDTLLRKYFRVSIIDEGPGVEEENRSKLFLPYIQLHSNELQAGKGTGLGLNISRSLVGLHGGVIGYKMPAIGRGSEFFFTVPMEVMPNSRASLPAGATTLAAPTPADPVVTAALASMSLVTAPMVSDSVVLSPTSQATVGGPLPHVVPDATPAVAAPEASSPIRLLRNPAKMSLSKSMSLSENECVPLPNTPRVEALALAPGSDVGPVGMATTDTTLVATPMQPPPPRILVVEDSLTSRLLLMRLLKRLGYHSHGVENGSLAVDLFRNADDPVTTPPFDLVLMDGNMPVMSGVEATRALRAMGITTSIIAVTGCAMEEDVQEFFTAGANAVVTKPVKEIILRAQLKKFLGGKSKGKDSPPSARRESEES